MPSPPLKVFLFSYTYRNQRWKFEIQAFSQAEAMARLSAMRDAQFDGELLASVPIPGLETPISWWRQLKKR